MTLILSRRGLITAGAATVGSTMLAGCDQLFSGTAARPLLDFGQLMSLKAQRLLLANQPLVREFRLADISPGFPPNGTEMPVGIGYFEFMVSQFENWRLSVDGLVRKKLSLSLDEIKKFPSPPQITQHSCDE